jgi:hypothetical protein
MNQAEQDRVSQGQSIAKGDTGDGATAVPEEEQGISNRPGDKASVGDADGVGERRARFADDEGHVDGDPDDGTSDDLESEPEER